jgi:nanoRNase/pAp phosphatase (c-di-AMP/oligoRNAs hydrolase)
MYTDKPNIDVGAIAKRYGGGGHVGASGFQCVSELPFNLPKKKG